MPEPILQINYKDPLLNTIPTQGIECCVCLDNFSTYIALIYEKKILGLKVYHHKDKISTSFIEEDFKQFDILNQQYKSLSLFVGSQKNTLIPTVAFDSLNIEQYISFNFESVDNEVILYDNLVDLGITNVFTVPRYLKNTLNNIFPGAVIKSQKTVLLEQFYRIADNSENIFVHTRQDCFDICVFKGKSLIFSNTFNYKTAQDYIFFMMQVIRQLELNPETIKLFLTGEMDKEGAIYSLIYKYVRHIYFVDTPKDTIWPLEDIPYHYFFNLVHI